MTPPSSSLYNSEFGLVSAQENFLVTAPLDQNSFNLTSNNPETLIIQILRRVVPRPGSFAFYQKKSFINETGRSYGHVQKGFQECLLFQLLQLRTLQKTKERNLMNLNR